MFSLLNRAVHHGEVRESGTKVVITTSADQWSYAVGFPKSPNVVGSKHLVLVDVLVETGRVSFGALAKDGNTFLFEREVGADEGPVTVEIPARDVAGCEVLMIRNVQGDGQASRVLVEAIRVYEGPTGV